MTFEYTNINGHRLRYRLGGEGPLVVFAHGLMGNIEQVTPAGLGLDALHARVRFLTYDARGHGQSHGHEDTRSITGKRSDVYVGVWTRR